jgi:hypothetical protein
MIYINDDCGVIDGMEIDREKPSMWGKSSTITLSLPQITHDLK